jgi:hypothetical protein
MDNLISGASTAFSSSMKDAAVIPQLPMSPYTEMDA